MKPILIFLLGVGALYALQQQRKQSAGGTLIAPQQQRGIATFDGQPSPQQPAYVYAAWQTPPLASRRGGYVPAFGPFVDRIDPDTLYFNQA